MKRLVSIILSVLLLFSVFSSASVGLAAKADGSEYLTFTLNSSGKSYSVTNCDNSAKGDIVIPAKYNGKPVVAIGYETFRYCNLITSVTIPVTISYFGQDAFSYNQQLKKIYYCGTLDQWASIDFYNDRSNPLISDAELYIKGEPLPTELNFSDSLTEIKQYTFLRCHKVVSINIGNNVKKIGNSAFYYCNELKTINIPYGVTEIGNSVFEKCSSLESVVLPESITFLGYYLFSECWQLSSVNIPEKTRIIHGYTFNRCEKLTKIVIPNNVTTIGAEAFARCSNLSIVYLPESVTYLGSGAFNGCNSLNYVYYSGNESDYAQIKGNSYISKKAIYYNVPFLKTITNCAGGVGLTWHKIDDATGYNVYRRILGENNWKYISTVKGTSYIDTKAQNGVYNIYTVRPVNSDGICGEYDRAGKSIKYIQAPKITGTSNSPNGIYMKWNAIPGAKSYRVYRRGLNYNSWYYLGSTKNTWYTDTKIKNANGYYYKYTVIAVNNGASGFYDGTYMKRLSNPVLQSAVSTKSGVSVKWNSVFGSTGYYVYRKTANSGWSLIGSVKGTDNTTYLDKTAKKGVTYTYTVRAYYGKTLSYYNSGISCKDKY